jgi:NAD(P)-dependent dehydrogenase (short-subunit alcohol dehydrogenase family)
MATKKRIALVTGGNQGLAFETCRQLAQLGLSVILSVRDITKGKIASDRLSEKGLDVTFYQLDISDESHINRIADQVENQFGRIDVLVNNAAILYDTWENAADADFDTVNQALRTNLFGPWRLTQKCILIMERNNCGRIVNVSSDAGSLHFMTGGGTPAYSISKAALNTLTRILAAGLTC